MELDLKFSGDGEALGVRLYSDEAHWTEVGFDVGGRSFIWAGRTRGRC